MCIYTMLHTEYLSSTDGTLIPIEHFNECMFVLYFTKEQSVKCKNMLHMLAELRLEQTFTNIIFVQVSMDNTIIEWNNCFKNQNWLQFPYFPIHPRLNLFKQFKVDRLPHMVACCTTSEEYITFPRFIYKDIEKNHTLSIVQELRSYLDTFYIDDFVII